MRIGVDLGGTKIEAIVLAPDGDIQIRERIPTPQGDYDATVTAIRDLIATIATRVGVDASVPVGVAIPGTISPATGLVKNANSTCLIGRALDRHLAEALHRPVRLANDANCFALSEAADGAARGAEVVFGVILGTGVGGGLVVRGTPLAGANLIAGEWGHNPLPWPDAEERRGAAACYCGKSGCIETYLSGAGLARDHQRRGGAVLEAPEIAAMAATGDAGAAASLERHERRLAKALASVINIVDPDVIVLGGGLSNLPGLADRVPRYLPAHVFSDEVTTSLRRAEHGDSSGVRGAAWLWPVAAEGGGT